MCVTSFEDCFPCNKIAKKLHFTVWRGYLKKYRRMTRRICFSFATPRMKCLDHFRLISKAITTRLNLILTVPHISGILVYRALLEPAM